MDKVVAQSPVTTSQRGRSFPSLPPSWFHVCTSAELDRGPVSLTLAGKTFVAFRTESGRVVVLSGRCSHMGARLANGRVNGERIACPLHGWEYGSSGRCEHIPAQEEIPDFARQSSYVAEERCGQVFFFSRARAWFPLPFFDGLTSEHLLAAKPFELFAEAPWFFVGANGFDIQHFRMAHDRVLLEEPMVSSPSPFARRVVAKFAVAGTSVQDRITRWIAGSHVTMDVTSWGGTMILVRAEFRRTTSFGIFNVLPIDDERTLGRVIVWVRRSRGFPARMVFDPLNAAIRRLFIQAFLRSDLPRIAGLRYQPANLIAADALMSGYFEWLEKASNPSEI